MQCPLHSDLCLKCDCRERLPKERNYDNMIELKPTSYTYMPTEHGSDIAVPYKIKNNIENTLKQFYEECNQLKKPYSMEFNSRNFDEMKIFYASTIKAPLTACFDKSINDLFETNAKRRNDKCERIEISGSLMITQTKEMLNGQKDFLIKQIKDSYSDNKWYNLGLEKWLDKKIKKINISEKQGTIGDVIKIVDVFWLTYTKKWAEKNGLEKYIPDQKLKDCMSQTVEEFKQMEIIKLSYSDCLTFVISYLMIDGKFKEEMLNFRFTNCLNEFSFKTICLVREPKENDLIIYLDSKNQPIHFGVFLDSTRVISKSGNLAIFKHNPEDEVGTSYVIVRKVEV